MAMADGVLAPEEKSMLDRLGSAYLKQYELESWDQAFQNPMDLEHVAREISIADRPVTAKLAYMVISASRDYGFPVNAAERQAFDPLAQVSNSQSSERPSDPDATQSWQVGLASGTF